MISMLKSLPVALILTAAVISSAGCNPVRPPIEGRTDPYGRRQIMFTGSELRDRVLTDDPQVSRDPAGLLHVQVPIRSNTDRALDIEYRAAFFDEAGVQLNQTTWFHLGLPPRVSDMIQINSTTPRAADFKVEIRPAQ